LEDLLFNGGNFLLTDGCNLKCVYCYESAGGKPTKTITPQIIDAAIEYMVYSAHKAGLPNIHANMFGGEPTVAFDALRYATDRMRTRASEEGLRSNVTITTNGVMSKRKATWLANNMNRIMISIDGKKETHNAQRQQFDRVLGTAELIYGLVGGKNLAFRATVSEASVAEMPEFVEYLGSRFPGTKIAFEPLFGLGRGKGTECKPPEDKVFFERFLDSLHVAKQHECKLKTSILNLGSKTKVYCGVAGRNFMIGPDGTVATCNRMMTSEEPVSKRFIYGRFDPQQNSFVFDASKIEWLKRITTDSVGECQNCFALFSCRGDCAANKAALSPTDFWKSKGYRCPEIREFVARVLLYVLDYSDGEIGG
jgi:uncharacterized protein